MPLPALHGAMTYEMVVELERRGFQWKPMPGKKTKLRTSYKFAVNLNFPDGEPKVWLGSPHKNYLSALLEPLTVMEKAAVRDLPHGKPNIFTKHV